MGTLIGFGVIAIVAATIWARLGRLEFQIEQLRATIKRLRADHAAAVDSRHQSSDAEQQTPEPPTPEPQPSLPFNRPHKPTPEPARPVGTNTPPRQPVADPPADTSPPLDAKPVIGPSLPLQTALEVKSEPVPTPVETTIPPRQPVADPPADTSPPIDARPIIGPSLPLQTAQEAKSEPVPLVETTKLPLPPTPPPVDEATGEPTAAKDTAPSTTPGTQGSSTEGQGASRPRQTSPVPKVARNGAPPRSAPPTPSAAATAATQVRRASTTFQDKARALWRKRPSLERVFGARLAVWMGGAALAMAGYFLVAYSIELGLVTPAIRMVFGGAFGLLLLAGAEMIHRRPDLANGRRIAQAMAGAGIADLYVMLYIATTVFDLLPPTAGFLGLAATTAIALLLAIRLGPPTAVMGLIGGFATPALAGASEPNVPVLLAYLFLVIGGLHLLIRNRGWWWLGIPATLGGFGWVGLLLTTEIAAQHSTSLGLFLVAISALAFLSGGHRKSMPLGQVLRDARTLTPLITGGIALAQLAIVVGVAEFGWLDWGLFGLLAAGCIAIGLYDENTAILPPIALIVSIGLLGLSPAQSSVQFSVVAGVAFALFAGAGYWQTWRGRRPLLWLGQAVVASLGIYGIAYVKLHDAPYDFGADPVWAGIALLLAAPAAATAYALLKRRAEPDGTDDRPALMAGATASAFIATTLILAVPGALLPLAVALQAAATALIARRLRADFVNWYNIAVGALFVVALATVPTATPMDALWRLLAFGGPLPPMAGLIDTLLIYLLPALAMAVVARFSTLPAHRFAAGWVTTILVAIGLAGSVPGTQLPLAYALLGLAVVALAARRPADGMAAGLATQVFPIGMLFVVALLGVPTATPLDALWRLFTVGGSEPPAASLIDTLWVYMLPALAMAAMARLSTVTAQRSAAGWAATLLIAIGLAASVPGAQLPLAYALQALAVVALATRLGANALNRHAIPVGILLSIAVVAVPTATPLDALWRLFAASGSEPAAASLIDTLRVYLLPALAMAAIFRLSTVPAHRIAAGWAATVLVALGLAASVPGAQLPLAYALQGLAVVALAARLRAGALNRHAPPLGMLLVIAVVAVPTATPLDALWRLFAANGSEPAAASLIDTLWVYLLPALAMAAMARLSTLPLHRIAAGWAATALVAFGLAASVPGAQLPLAYALQGLAVVALANRLRIDTLNRHAIPLGMLLAIALMAAPTATPLDALLRLFTANGSEPAAASLFDTLWVYLLPAAAMAAAARLSTAPAYRIAAGWAVTVLVAFGLAVSVPGAQLPLAYALQGLAVVALARHLRAGMLNLHALPLGMLLVTALMTVPTATPLDALIRLFTANGAEPAAASLIDTFWVYLLPAAAMATIAWISTASAHRLAAGWAATSLVAIGLAASVPGTQLPLAYALQGLAMVAVGARLRNDLPNLHAIPIGILFAIALIAVPESVPLHALLNLLAPDAYVSATVGLDTVMWIFVLPALAAAAAARLTGSALQRLILAGVAAGLVTLALSAALPADWLPLAIGVEALLLALLASRHKGYALYSLSIATVLIYLVQIVPLVFQIAVGTLPSLIGTPVLAGDLPGLAEFLRRVALPAIPIAAMAAWLPGERLDMIRRSVAAIGGVSALLLAYIAVKALFGIEDGAAFQARGFFERALMTQLCFIAGAVAYWLSRRERYQALSAVGLSFTLVALGRLVWFDLAVFNPMFLAQEVGALPLLNGLLIVYGLPILWLTLLGRTPGLPSGSWLIAGKAAILALVTILVGYQVRQFFQGGLLIGGPVGTAELYGYSAAALATGIGFLVWGTAREDRLVRLVSLALVLAAVGKVFLYDASELTGLWRIAAFAGLGFSLLGISWFYTRYVFVDQRGRQDRAETP